MHYDVRGLHLKVEDSEGDPKDGEDRKKESEDKTPAANFREAPAGESRLRKIVGDCREKLKINRKKVLSL